MHIVPALCPTEKGFDLIPRFCNQCSKVKDANTRHHSPYICDECKEINRQQFKAMLGKKKS